MIKHTELVFGIPTVRSKKEEKYPNDAVLTMLAVGEKGTAKKIDINTFAVEQLEFLLDGNDKANFAFTMVDNEQKVFFANTSTMENPTNINVTKQATFSNKKMYEYLAKVFELDTSIDNELILNQVEGNVAEVRVLKTDTTPVENDPVVEVLQEVPLETEPNRTPTSVTSDEGNQTTDAITE
jgi:hypothetical protein